METEAIFEIVQQNFVGVITSLFLILFIITNNNFEKRTNRLFLLAALCVLFLIVEETWESRLALSTSYEPLRVPLSAIGYTLRVLLIYFLVLMFRSNRRWALLVSIPMIFNTLVSFSSLFCKISFWYTEDNQFVRGPLGLTPFLISSFYIILLLLLNLLSCKRGDHVEALIVSAIVVVAFISTILQSVFHFRAIQNACMATSITFYYMFLHSNRNNRDPLTGALIRRRFYLDAERYCSTISAVISLDINGLKQINDEYGHEAGDKALICFTECIKDCIRQRASLYRIGGDEFMIICYKMDENAVQTLIEKMQWELGKTPYRCAFGYSMYSALVSFDQICQTADQAMYKNKRLTKENTTV